MIYPVIIGLLQFRNHYTGRAKFQMMMIICIKVKVQGMPVEFSENWLLLTPSILTAKHVPSFVVGCSALQKG